MCLKISRQNGVAFIAAVFCKAVDRVFIVERILIIKGQYTGIAWSPTALSIEIKLGALIVTAGYPVNWDMLKELQNQLKQTNKGLHGLNDRRKDTTAEENMKYPFTNDVWWSGAGKAALLIRSAEAKSRILGIVNCFTGMIKTEYIAEQHQ